MADHLIISDFVTGFETDRPIFGIKNDAFPTIINMYPWRGRLQKKRGTQQLGRLQRLLEDTSLGNSPASATWTFNIFMLLGLNVSQPNASIVPMKPPSSTFEITDGTDTFTDNGDGTLAGGTGGSTINYATGAITLNRTISTVQAFTITFTYYPDLPVMGFEDFQTDYQTPGLVDSTVPVAFDTMYSYRYDQGFEVFYDTTFYKITQLPFVWSGQDYQQFFSVNYQGAMWVTNGKPGFNMFLINSITAASPTGTTTTITTATPNPLITGDIVWINETTGTDSGVLNGKSFAVTVIDDMTFYITATTATINNVGMFQLMTNTIAGRDGIKWYDGDGSPVTGSAAHGWVNFAPPLSNSPNPEYLVGAQLIAVFKDRLLFFGTFTATSATAGNPIFNQDQVVWSQNGTPYYSDPVPDNQTFEVAAWYQNIIGRGGFLNAGVAQQIMVVGQNQDVLVTKFESRDMKLIYTSDDSNPFIFQTINTEIGSNSTFSGITLDMGILSIGQYGITMTTQNNTQRIDIIIPDWVFQISVASHANQRITAVRDFRNEFIYFTVPTPNNAASNDDAYNFPTQTLLYNYRENNWSIFQENYTHYGTFRRSPTGRTWGTLNQWYPTWADWNDAWNYGSGNSEFPSIAAGNQQGFVMIKDIGTGEQPSGYIQAITTTLPPSPVVITSPNHGLLVNDYVTLQGIIGGSDVEALNGQIFQITITTVNTFQLDIDSTIGATSYLGGGTFTRLTNINVETKQFPVLWDSARQARVGTQRFLFDRTDSGQVTVNIFTSQDNDTPSNESIGNPFLIYSNIVLTCPEPGFLNNQDQIWHRMSNSFNGDTIQLGFTLSDAQMRTPGQNNAEITLYAIVLDLYPGPILY